MATILVVDDSSSMRKLISFALQSAGHTIVEASDGAEGLDKAKSTNVNLVITDQNMPKMTGLELVKSLRALPNYKFTPILVLTTESSQDYKTKGREAGASGWIIKPFSPDTLNATVKKVLG